MFWIIVDRLKLVIGVLGLAIPFVGLGFGLWWQRRRRVRQQTSNAALGGGIGCVVGTLAAPILLFFALCTPPPGEGLRAREGRGRAAVVMAALDQFHARHQTFPESLRVLVPEWLPALALIGPAPRRAEGYPFEYRRTDSGYTLSFTYVGPGMNHCSISSVDRTWRCNGYF